MPLPVTVLKENVRSGNNWGIEEEGNVLFEML